MFALTAMSCVGMISAKKIVACTKGSGTENGCSGCDNSTAIEVTPWSVATKSGPFHLPGAEATSGGGYDVWWVSYSPEVQPVLACGSNH